MLVAAADAVAPAVPGPSRDAGEVRPPPGGAGGRRLRLPRASSRPTRSRPAARSASSPTAASSTTQLAAKLCRDIAKAIQEQLTYPGEVKVTVLRETRNVELAR